jgi:hypothetical protein
MEVLAHLSGSNAGFFCGIRRQDPPNRTPQDPVRGIYNTTPEFGRFRVTIFVIQAVNNPNFLTNTRKSLPARGLRVFLWLELNAVHSEWLDWHDDNHLSHRLHGARNDYSRTGSSGGRTGL